jgi:hypothetical protein
MFQATLEKWVTLTLLSVKTFPSHIPEESFKIKYLSYTQYLGLLKLWNKEFESTWGLGHLSTSL